MKTIDTLVDDMYAVVDRNGGWDATVSHLFSETLSKTVESRLEATDEERKPTLRMSNLGTPCARKLYYYLNDVEGEPLRSETKLKFLFGDILEDLLVALATAAGHKVEGAQDTMEIDGIKGHRDCVIDGVTVDIKSASSFAFTKFQSNSLRSNDSFGYISQLSSYVYAGKNDPLVTDKTGGAFLVIDKQHGKMCLDYYDFTEELKTKAEEVSICKAIEAHTTPPERGFKPQPDGKSGNMKLAMNCSYCMYKKECWPEVRTFLYSTGPRYLTTVANLPKVMEIK
jgi:hypothetical protein